jgi:hypothetical protein
MDLQFIDRDDEVTALNNLLQRESASLVLLYGRRRIGKTRLIQEFMKQRKSLYLYTQNAEEKTILAEYSRAVEGDFFPGFRFTDFTSFLNFLEAKCREGVIVSIDEFQRLTNIDGAISLLQKHWDEGFSKGKGMLILSGSSIGAMHKLALSGDAPLYGRRAATIKVNPLKYLDLTEWFHGYPPEDLVKIYGSFGGTPAYLELVDEKSSTEENIVERILDRNSSLYNEPEMLLMEEIRAPQRYMDILSALAQGRNTLSEIADSTGISRENTSAYLGTLDTLDLIERITPVTDPEAKRGLYIIKDPFFRFWFRFVRPNKRQLEFGLERNVWESIEKEFNQHLGYVFEDICREAVTDMGRRGTLPIRLDSVGRWWMKDNEIDIVGLEKGGRLLAIEVKWSSLDYRDSERLLKGLSLKAQHIQGVGEPLLGIMAKRIEGKEKLRDEGFLAMDLAEITGNSDRLQ